MFGKDKGNIITPAKNFGNDQQRRFSNQIWTEISISPHQNTPVSYQVFRGLFEQWHRHKKQYFVFLFLPFGVGSAVHCITKLRKPILAHLHLKGICNSIFIDDGRLLVTTAEEVDKSRKLAYQLLEKSVWTLESQKSDKEGQASKNKEYLGFVINTASR